MAGQSEHTYQLAEAAWPRLAEAVEPVEAALSSGRVRAGGRVGVSALGGSPCAQLSLVGHHCTGEECGEVQARCRRGAGEDPQAGGVQDSVLAGRKVLTIPHALLADEVSQLGGVAGVRRRVDALLRVGEQRCWSLVTCSSEAAGRCAQCAQSSKVQRTVRAARVVRVVRAAVRAAVLTMSRCVATCCCLALDRRHSVTDCHRRHSVTDCASFRPKRPPAVRGVVQYRDVTAPVGRGVCGSGGGGAGGRRESSAAAGAGGAGKYLTVALHVSEP